MKIMKLRAGLWNWGGLKRHRSDDGFKVPVLNCEVSWVTLHIPFKDMNYDKELK